MVCEIVVALVERVAVAFVSLSSPPGASRLRRHKQARYNYERMVMVLGCCPISGAESAASGRAYHLPGKLAALDPYLCIVSTPGSKLTFMGPVVTVLTHDIACRSNVCENPCSKGLRHRVSPV